MTIKTTKKNVFFKFSFLSHVIEGCCLSDLVFQNRLCEETV